MHGAGVILRRVDLNLIDAVKFRFAHSGTREQRAVDIFVFGVTFEKPRRRISIVVGGTRVDRLANDLHSRTLHVAGIDRIA